MNDKLHAVTNTDDIISIYRDTPIGRLLEYHNLERVHVAYRI